MPDPKPDRPVLYRYVELGQVGMEMVVPIVGGILLDRWLDWTPWLTIVGAVFGLVGGMIHLLAILKNVGPGDDTKDV